MKGTKKAAATREREFELAIHRIQHGRAHTGSVKVGFTSVAEEVGVSPALIHNHYPRIADRIRELQGKTARSERDRTKQALAEAHRKAKELRAELKRLTLQIRKLASINERLTSDLARLQPDSTGKVRQLPQRRVR